MWMFVRSSPFASNSSRSSAGQRTSISSISLAKGVADAGRQAGLFPTHNRAQRSIDANIHAALLPWKLQIAASLTKAAIVYHTAASCASRADRK
jgi:hypothetical protein